MGKARSVVRAGLDLYATDRKVYAEGLRVDEVPVEVPPNSLEDQGIVAVVVPGKVRKRRKVYRRLPFGAVRGFAPICHDSHHPETLHAGLKKRLLREVPKLDMKELTSFMTFVEKFLERNVKPIVPYTFEEWISAAPYTVERKTQLRVVYEELNGSRPSFHDASHVDSFMKTEYYDEFKACRWINSRCDKFKVYSGRFFKAIEDEVFNLKWFIKHHPVPDRPKLIANLRREGAHYFVTDYTAFESHFSPELMNACECKLYRHCLSGCEEDAEFICRVITGKNRLRTRSGLRCTLRGRRMSGDMCTSLGNGFTNLMLTLYVAYKEKMDVDGFVEGDDGIFACSGLLTEKMYHDLGFTIKIAEVEDPQVGSFCGMVFSGEGNIIRDPRHFLAGFGWTHSFIHAGRKVMDSLLRAKALSTLYETPNCPIVAPMAHKALELTRNVAPRFIHDGYHEFPKDEFSVPEFKCDVDTRELFERLYGVSIEAQILIEQKIARGDLDFAGLIEPGHDMSWYADLYLVPT